MERPIDGHASPTLQDFLGREQRIDRSQILFIHPNAYLMLTFCGFDTLNVELGGSREDRRSRWCGMFLRKSLAFMLRLMGF